MKTLDFNDIVNQMSKRHFRYFLDIFLDILTFIWNLV